MFKPTKVWENGFYLLGVVFFVAVLRRTKPNRFYGLLFPAMMTVLVGTAAVISMPNVSQWALALSLESCVSMENMFVLDSYVSKHALHFKLYGSKFGQK